MFKILSQRWKQGAVALVTASTMFGMVAFSAPQTAQAVTVAELQVQINALLAQIAALGGGSTSTVGCYAFTRDLTIGSQGSDVVSLQNYLKSTGHFPVTTGSTGYFGPITQSSLSAWQSAHAVAPAAGYWGPISRAKYNSLCTVVIPPIPGDDDDDDDDDNNDGLSGGEADLSGFSGSSGDDSNVEEGDDADVYEFEFDVDDGDVRIERVDLMFKATGTEGDDKPWQVFDDITLMLNGKEIETADGGDEDNWDEDADDEYRIRFSGLKTIVREDDKAEFVVNVATQSSVDDADGDVSWTIWVAEDGVRVLDGEGIDHTIGDSDTLAGADEEEEFDIDEEGEGEELNLKSSSNDPESSTLLVEDDDRSDWYEVFIFRLEAEGGDIDLDELTLLVTTDSENYDEVVNDVVIEIDGEEFDDFDVAGGGTTEATLTFDLDGDFTIDEDDEVEVVVMMEFRPADNYTDGVTTIQVETVSVEGEGADDVEDVRTVSGDEHTLSTSVAVISGVSADVSKSEDDSTGYINFTFTVEAEEGDVTFIVVDNADVDGSTDGVMFSLLGAAATSTTSLVLIDGDATYNAGTDTWTINEGDEAEFALDTTLTGAGTHRVKLESVAGQTVDKTSGSVNLQ